MTTGGNLDLSKLNVIAFDMDMTLVQYKYEALNDLIFGCLKEHLSTIYPFLCDAKMDMEFCKRGVVIDLDTGYFLKLDSKKRVVKAYNGDEQVSREIIDKLYHGEGIDSGEGPLHHFTGNHSSRFFTLISNFEIPAGSIFRTFSIHLIKKSLENNEPIDYSQYKKFTYNLVKAYDKHFDNFYKSLYYTKFQEDPSLYVYQASEKCKQFLRDLRSNGTKVLLVTNSKSEYTQLLMNYCYGKDFQDLFDLIITDAKKPEFFKSDKTFYDLKTYEPKDTDLEDLKCNDIEFDGRKVYQGGNVKVIIEKVEKEFKEQGNKEDIRFCYVGDNLMCDIIAPKQYCKWMTIAIIDEVDYPEETVYLKQQQIQIQANKGNDSWGSFFYSFTESITTITTFWSSIISQNADYVISSIDTLVDNHHQHHKHDIESPLKPCAIIYK